MSFIKSNVIVKCFPHFVWSFEESVDPRELVDQGYILSECVHWRSGRFGEARAVERIGIV